MKVFIALAVVIFSTNIFALQDQKLPNGKWAYYGEEFYQRIGSKNKLDRELLFQIFDQAHISQKGKFDTLNSHCTGGGVCYGHVTVGYDRARKIMFGELDLLKDSKGTHVLDVYCGQKFYFRSLDEVSAMHTMVNIEHTWPQSKFNRRFPKEQQKSDMHHLFLTDSAANSVRGNSPFGLVSQSNDRFGGEGCKNSKSGFSGHTAVYTPPAPHRGNVARALFYFSIHYNLLIDPNQERILRSWHNDDPVDSSEIKRHEAIAKHQKVRNPFVDHPSIVDQISDF